MNTKSKKQTKLKKQTKNANQQQPLVSIITVSYNSAATLPDTLESVQKQSYDNLEYIVIDGGSTDNSVELVEDFAQNFSGRCFHLSEADDGIADAFNKGIAHARGEIVGILNSDDYYRPDTVANAVAALLEDPARQEEAVTTGRSTGYVFGDLLYVDGQGETQYRYAGDAEYATHIYSIFALNHPSWFVWKWVYDRMGGYDTRFRYSMDYEMFHRLYAANIFGLYSPEVVTNMRLEGASDSGYLVSYKECRDIAVEYGQKPWRANLYLLGVSLKSVTRRLLDRIMPAFIVRRIRRFLNPSLYFADEDS